MNTDDLKLSCPKCGEEFSNAEKIKIIDRIDSFRRIEECKNNIESLKADIQRLISEIKISDTKTEEYAAKIDETDDNTEEKSYYKECIISEQVDRFKKEKMIAEYKTDIEQLEAKIVEINNRFDIKEFFSTTNVLCADNDYADFVELVKDTDSIIRFRAKDGFLESEYKENQTVFERFLSKYYLSAMFSSTKKNSNIIFYEFKTQKPEQVKIGIKYGKDEANALTEIENWLNDIDKPEDKGNYRFLLIPSEQIDFKNLYPNHYAPKYSTIEEYMQTKDTVNLSEVAQIIIPKCDYKKKGSVLKTDEYYSGISGAIDCIKNKLSKLNVPCENAYITDCLLQKDDIIISGYRNFTFLVEQPQKDVYANNYNHIVLRTKDDFSPEYLYNYVTSNLGYFLASRIDKKIFKFHHYKENNENILNKLGEVPVIVPKKGATDFDDNEFNATVNKFAEE